MQKTIKGIPYNTATAKRICTLCNEAGEEVSVLFRNEIGKYFAFESKEIIPLSEEEVEGWCKRKS